MKIIKDFDLYSPEWLEITFNKRNKTYGAYELRDDSSNRHIKAIIIVFFVGLFAIFLPLIVETITWPTEEKPEETSGVTMAKIDEMPEDDKTPEALPIEIEPPPTIKETVAATEWRIDEDKKATQEVLTTQELNVIDVTLGATTQAGEKGPITIDEPINNPIVETKEPERFPDIRAGFPGGTEALMKYLHEKINYPQDALDKGVEGTVRVEFVVSTDGTIGSVKALNEKLVDASLVREAIREVKSMPAWNPAQSNGVNVASYFQLPVEFQLAKKPKN